MGCQCDAGFYGPDCSLRKCKNGVDPLYLDDSSTVKYPVFNVAQFTNIDPGTDTTVSALFNDGTPLAGTGYWAIRFYDHHGQGWLTNAIAIDATCPQVVAALEALPNNVIPKGQTKCVKVSAISALEQSGFGDGSITSTADITGNSKHLYYMMFKMALWDMQLPANAIETDTYNLQIQNSLYSSGSTVDFPPVGSPQNPISISGVIYRLHFNGNPGALREPEIEIYLDGKRPSLASSRPTASPTEYGKTSTKVWTDGQQGEDLDYFGNHCDGVTVQVAVTDLKTINGVQQYIHYLTSFTPTSKALLKSCLGDANLDASDNVEVYNWDYGSAANPHIIKLVRTVSTFMDGGYYVVLWYDTNICSGDPTGSTTIVCDNLGFALSSVSGYNVVGLFRLLHPFVPPDNAYLEPYEHDSWEIYTTKGTLAKTSDKSQAVFGFGSKYIYTTNMYSDTSLTDDATPRNTYAASYSGDLSCEAGNSNTTLVRHCMNVTDIFTMLWWDDDSAGTNPNPPYINLYKANRIYTTQSKNLATDVEAAVSAVIPGTAKPATPAQYMTHVIESDLSTNWAASAIDQSYKFRIYKFIPAKESTYTYVAECANRGICDTTAGACTCFAGYTSDSCSEQSSLQL